MYSYHNYISCEPEVVFAIKTFNNKVIACSYTFERVQENSEKLWRFERYTVINDYDWRIPSPINLIFLPYRFIVRPGKQTVCGQHENLISMISIAKFNVEIMLKNLQNI